MRPLTRTLAASIVPILLAAFIILHLFPNDTGRHSAWPIQPTMSAMMLGATYLGGAYFFTRVVFNQGWASVKLGVDRRLGAGGGIVGRIRSGPVASGPTTPARRRGRRRKMTGVP